MGTYHRLLAAWGPTVVDQHVVLIAGASSEIGQATGRLLARNGYRVFGTAREPKQHADGDIEMLPMDVTSEASVRACVDAVLERAGRINVLVNLASYVVDVAIEEVTMEEVRSGSG